MVIMRGLRFDQKQAVEEGMKFATDRLVRISQSPLVMGGTFGLVYFIDGPTQGLNWVSDFQFSPDFDEGGFPRELFESLANFFDDLSAKIRSGAYDDFCKPSSGQPQEVKH